MSLSPILTSTQSPEPVLQELFFHPSASSDRSGINPALRPPATRGVASPTLRLSLGNGAWKFYHLANKAREQPKLK
jgi:hypothetical protein